MKLGLCFLVMVLSNTLLPALINASVKKLLAWVRAQKKVNKTTHLYDNSEREMKAFIVLWHLRGALNWTFHQVRTVFSSVYDKKLFSATMYVNRFVFLSFCFRFDDIRSRTEIFQKYRATAISDVYEMFNHSCAKVSVPDEFLSLNGIIYPTRVGLAFRQNVSQPSQE